VWNQHGVIYDPATDVVITLDSPDAKPSGGVETALCCRGCGLPRARAKGKRFGLDLVGCG
jgi:hypothetical protein